MNRRLLVIPLVLIAAVVGYFVAPNDMQNGEYKLQVTAEVTGESISLEHVFLIGDVLGEPVTVSEIADAQTLVLQARDAYPNLLGEDIYYELRLLNAEGDAVPMQLSEASSLMTGAEYEQVIPPSLQDDGALIFRMRILHDAQIMTALLFAVVVLWLTEFIPVAATALLIPVVVVLAGVTDVTTAFESFFHPIIVLFLGGFLIAQALHRTKTDELIAKTILKYSSHKPMMLMLTLMIVTAFLSMWMSNTASSAVMLPIALAVLGQMTYNGKTSSFTKAVLLGVAYSATVGGIGSAIGTPANMLAITFINDLTNEGMTFVDWFAYGVPVLVLMLPIIWIYLLITFRVDRHDSVDLTTIKGKMHINRQQIFVLAVLGFVMFLWLTERWNGIPIAVSTLIGVMILYVFQLLKESDLNAINWNALLTFGGGLTIGSLMVASGVSDYLALQLTGLSSLPTILVVFIIAAITLFVGALISNTAVAAMMIPLAIPLAQILQIDPRLVVAVIAIASSLDFAMVIGTPPTMMAYSTGKFTTREIFWRGIALDIIGLFVLVFVVTSIWAFLGVVEI